MKLAACLLFALPLFAQPQQFVYMLGLPTDPCVGGTPYTIPQGGFTTMRYGYGTFSCTFSLPAATAYVLLLDFVEVSVTAPGQRAFSVSVNDTPVLAGFDLYAAGGTDPGKVVSRSYLGYTMDGTIRIRFDPIVRCAVISRVTIAPAVAFNGPAFLGAIGSFVYIR